MYRWIIQIIELPCDCPDKNENTLNIVKVEIDPIGGQILGLRKEEKNEKNNFDHLDYFPTDTNCHDEC